VSGRPPLALVHDYLTQRGGAERVVAALAAAWPEVPLYTSFFEPASTFPEFATHSVRTLPIDRVKLLRHHHRVALPVLASAFSRLMVDADVTVCSSSGWAHGVRVSGRKVVYCHTPARWLYQTDRYLTGTSRPAAAAIALLGPRLRRWDRKAASTADRYLANSHAVRDRIADLYGIDAEVVHPPVDFATEGDIRAPVGVEPGFTLCVSRLLPYKNVEAVCAAFGRVRDLRGVVVGSGPLAARLAQSRPANVTLLGSVDDATLRWLYQSCSGLVAASYEDFGLTPIEAAGFGKPTAALRWGGYLDTIVEGRTGVFFDDPAPQAIAESLSRLAGSEWDGDVLAAHAERFSRSVFIERMNEVVDEERARL
jgi:glycosyltransferase involved in cell wall biosynthesis